jgi:hypothetical protein
MPMMKTLGRIILFFAVAAAGELAAVAQDCATVTLVGSAVSNTNVQAHVNLPVSCRGDATVGFVDASVNTASSNPAAANAFPFTKAIGSDGTTGVQISPQPVTACTSVTLTFTIRFKVKRLNGTVGPEQVQTVTKTLIVCPFRFDLQVVAVAVMPSEAGQDSQVTVTLVNQGAQTPGAGGGYNVTLTTVEDTSDLVRNSCAPTSALGVVSFPQLTPGEQRTLTRNFKFPQAGAFSLKAEVSLLGSEDGPRDNNSLTQTVTVPLPRPLVFEVAPLTTRPNDPVKISGNWFRTLGTSKPPTVQVGGVQARVIEVASPLEMIVRMPDLRCAASGQVSVTIANSTGATTFRNGPTFPRALTITGTSADPSAPGPSEDLTINLSNFRPKCTFSATLEPSPLTPEGTITPQVLSTTAESIIVRVRPPGAIAAYTLKVQTPYGVATKPITLSASTLMIDQ